MTEKYKINVILEDDLLKILRSHNLLKDIQGGKTRCSFCGIKITVSSIESLQKINGQLHLKCDGIDCEISNQNNND